MIETGYRERQDGQVAKQAAMQIAYNAERELMARGRPASWNAQAKELDAALKFINVASGGDQLPTDGHIMLVDKWALASNRGQMFAGHPITEDLGCCPHLGQLKSALIKCGKTLSLTQLESGRLSVKGDKLRALVPCLTFEEMPDCIPDPNIAPVTDELKECFKALAGIADEKADTVIEASLLLEANTCSATDRRLLVQWWHGINLPPHLVIPKIFAQAVAKQELKLVGFGYTEGHSITLYFENGAWIKTLLYVDEWPDIYKILNVNSSPIEAPEGFFEAAAAIADFSENGDAFFLDNKMQSHLTDNEGAQYDVPGLQGGRRYGADYLVKVGTFADKIDVTSFLNAMFFFGPKARGALAAISVGGVVELEPAEIPL